MRARTKYFDEYERKSDYNILIVNIHSEYLFFGIPS